MKMPLRILLIILCAAMVMSLPFVVSAPNMLNDVKMELMNDGEDEDEIDFGRLFFSGALAENAETENDSEEVTDEEFEVESFANGEFTSHPEWALPYDFTPGIEPDPVLYSESGYEDDTIRVSLEEQSMDDGTKMFIARIQISDPSQIRTGVANPEKVGSTKARTVPAMAKIYNAVIAINGDNYIDKPEKTTFEYRMTKKIRSKANKTKDILVIDDQGDFHLFIRSKGIKDFPKELQESGRKLINAFTFGPALVKDGELLDLDDKYGYNPHGREPRAAIGQTGPLSYVLVIIQAQDRNGNTGMSQGKLAEFMYGLGCIQAFNLDGGNSAELVFGEKIVKGMKNGDDRTLSDIIYFASLQR